LECTEFGLARQIEKLFMAGRRLPTRNPQAGARGFPGLVRPYEKREIMLQFSSSNRDIKSLRSFARDSG